MVLPDKITIFQKTIEAKCRNEEEILAEIEHVVSTRLPITSASVTSGCGKSVDIDLLIFATGKNAVLMLYLIRLEILTFFTHNSILMKGRLF